MIMELKIGDKIFKADIRKASDLKPVLAFPEMLKEDFDAYYMFRDVFKSESDRRKILKAKLRYDYTVIPPAEIGGEWIKTYGHYHPEVAEGITYPEVYQVIEGEAIYLLQKKEGEIVTECIAVKAKEGEIVVIPPNYGHVTINPSKSRLMMANWVCREFSSIYEPYTKMRGACYYYINDKWIKNENYSEVPEIAFGKPVNVLEVDGEMYVLVDELEKLKFLVEPHKHSDFFKNCIEF